MKLMDAIEREGGHMIIVLIVLLIGVTLLLMHVDYGKDLCESSAGALWMLMQIRRTGDHSVVMNDAQNVNVDSGHK